MPDVGNSPWAWVKDASDETTWVGGNCAEGSHWDGEHLISKELISDFGAWAIYFDNQKFYLPEDCSDFDWGSFNAQGWALCTRLKEEIGDAAMVCYVKPSEDPASDITTGVEFLLGGGTQDYVRI